jgi:hypothetical protein
MGMYWGFSVDDCFWFSMSYTGEYDDINNQECYIQVDRFDQPTNYSGILRGFYLSNDDITVYYEDEGNYIEMDWAFFVFSLLYYRVYPDDIVVCGSGGLLTPFAFPLGNLSCLANLIVELHGQNHVVFLQSEDYWGFELTYSRFYNNTSIYPNWDVTMHAHYDFSKDDGFLAHYHGLTTYVGTGDIFQEVSLARNGFNPQVMTPVSFCSNTTPTSPSSNTSPLSHYHEQLALAMYMTAGIILIVAVLFKVVDYRKYLPKTN